MAEKLDLSSLTDEDLDLIEQKALSIIEKSAPNKEQSYGSRLGRAALNLLPAAGMVAGGALGAASPLPGGTIGGAALGAVGGESLKQSIQAMAFPEEAPKTREEQYKRLASEGLGGASAEMAGPVITKAIKGAVPAIKSIGIKAASTLTAVPEAEIKTFANRGKEVNDIIKSTGGDIQAAADMVRQETMSSIKETKAALNNQLKESILLSQDQYKTADINPIIQKLVDVKAGINEHLHPEQIAEIESTIGKIRSTSPNGVADANVLNDIKRFLQDMASGGAYNRAGQIFQYGEKSQIAAKNAASEARVLLEKIAPQTKQINQKLAELHNIEDHINKSLIAPGTNPASLLAIGSGARSGAALSGRDYLEKIASLTKKETIPAAENLAAARTFASPPLLPADSTGKAIMRSALASAAGTAIAGPSGMIIGAALSSPAALKTAINSGRVTGEMLSSLSPKILQNLLSNPEVSNIVAQALGMAGKTAIQRKMSENVINGIR